MPAPNNGFDVPVSWDQGSYHPCNKFCMVMPNIFSIIIIGLFSYTKCRSVHKNQAESARQY